MYVPTLVAIEVYNLFFSVEFIHASRIENDCVTPIVEATVAIQLNKCSDSGVQCNLIKV